MKNIIRNFVLITMAVVLSSLIVRHDIPDEQFIEKGKQYPQICHFPMGEGTLIGSSWIVTAAHVGSALEKDMNKGIESKAICDGKKYDIEEIIIHPEYKFTPYHIQHDIALIKINRDINTIPPVEIYNNKDELGKIITLVGAGDMGNGLTGPQKWDKITRAATNTIDFVDDQWISFTFNSPESGKATELEGVSGPGDSGGPALVTIDGINYLVGVSSNQRNSEASGPGHYGVKEYYARASSYAKWIKSQIKTQ